MSFFKIIYLSFAIVAVSAQKSMVSSILSGISNGLADARQSSVPASQASSEISTLVSFIAHNSFVSQILNSAASVIVAGINTSNLVSLAQEAASSYTAFTDSPDFSTVKSLVSAKGTEYDLNQALTNIESNLSPIFAVITPQIAALPTNSQVDNAVNSLVAIGEGAIFAIGSAAKQTPDITSVLISNLGGEISGSTASAIVASVLAEAASSFGSATSKASTSTVKSPLKSAEANERAVVGAFAIGGAAIAVANYLL